MDIAKICNALGNETRFQIVKALKDRSICSCCDKIEVFEDGVSVTDIVGTTGLAQSTVSQHLAVLEQAGVIVREKRSQWTCFFLNRALIEEFCAAVRQELIE